MYYYQVTSQHFNLSTQESIVQSEVELNEFDLLVIDTSNGFIVATIDKPLSPFDALANPYEPKDYLTKVNVEKYLKRKRADVQKGELLKKISTEAKLIKELESLKKYRSNPKIACLLEQYESINIDELD